MPWARRNDGGCTVLDRKRDGCPASSACFAAFSASVSTCCSSATAAAAAGASTAAATGLGVSTAPVGPPWGGTVIERVALQVRVLERARACARVHMRVHMHGWRCQAGNYVHADVVVEEN